MSNFVYTDGAYLTPMKLADGRWAWVATAFEDAAFHMGDDIDLPESELGTDEYKAHVEKWARKFDLLS